MDDSALPPSADAPPRRVLGVALGNALSIRATLALLVVACVLPLSVVAALLFVNYY